MPVTNAQDYYALCQQIQTLPADTPLAVDTETTGLRPWLDTELRGVCIGIGDESWYVPVSHPGSWNVPDTRFLRNALANTAALPVLHNAPYDFAILERGIGWAPPVDRYRDTQILAWLEDENRRKGLKYLGALFFGEDEAGEQKALKALMKGETKAEAYKRLRAEGHSAAESRELSGPQSAASKRTWADLTAEEIGPYAEQDAALTLRVHARLIQDAEYAAVEPAVQRMHDVQAAAYRMVRLGVAVDEGRVTALRDAGLAKMAEIEAQFDISLGSPKQLGALIYGEWGLPVRERTDSGQPSTARETLEAMAGEHAGLDLILEHRRLQKAVSSFYDTLLENLDPGGRVHTSFNVVGTVTGRWSSSEPNLQQIPKASTNADAKTVFTAPAGYELWSFDLQSAELRVAASLSGDTAMMAALDEPGRSFHRETAQGVFGSADEPYYTLAKNLNYGIPYGIGPKKFATYIAKGARQSPGRAHYQQAKNAIDMHRELWPDLHRAIANCAAYADVTGRLPLGWPGRFRHFVSQAPGVYPVPGYQAINSLVQGSVALYICDVMLAVEPLLSALGVRLVLQVHDSLAFEVPAGVAPALLELIQRAADEVNPFKLRMLFDMKPGL